VFVIEIDGAGRRPTSKDVRRLDVSARRPCPGERCGWGAVWLTVDPGLADTPSAVWRGGEIVTETLDSVDQRKIDHQELVQAKADGVELVGPNGLLHELTVNVLETVLGVGMEEHLGYGEHLVEGCEGGDSRNGRRGEDGSDRDRAGADPGTA
jgi:hypothetical protein